MKHRSHFALVIVGLGLATLLAPHLLASPVVFTVDEAQSKITLAGGILGNPVQEQGPGSLTTSFSGKINADVTPSAIQFTGGTMLAARTNGVWKPGPQGASGSAPADYAAQASTLLGSVKGALRNIVLDLTSGVLPIQNGQFDAAVLLFAFPTNAVASFDYDAGFLGAKGIALSGIATNKIVNGATLTTTGDSQTLSIQVDTEFKFTALFENDSSVRLTGKLVATQAALPTITSIELKGQTVTLRVQGAGSEPRLDSSPDLTTWTTQAPTRTSDANGAVLTLPAAGPQQFYRVAK